MICWHNVEHSVDRIRATDSHQVPQKQHINRTNTFLNRNMNHFYNNEEFHQ